MIGFKQYTIAALEYLIGERMRNYFLFYYGPRILLYVENRDFFYKGDNLITVEEGAQKTYDLYRNNTKVLYPEDTSFDFGTISESTLPYYEFAADYLKQNGRVATITPPDPSVSITPLRELFFQQLYKFKLQISLDITALSVDQRTVIKDFLDYLKTPTESSQKIALDESEYDLQLRTLLNGSNFSVFKFFKFQNDVGQDSGPCCAFADKMPLQPSVEGSQDPLELEPSRALVSFSASTTELDKKLARIIKACAGFGTDEKAIKDTVKNMSQAEKCYVCKRKKEFKGPRSILAEIESELSGTTLLFVYDALNCKQFGWSKKEGNVKGSTIAQGSAAASKCKKPFEEQNVDKGDFSNIADVADSKKFYRNIALRNAVNNTNDIIDQNLISVIDGE
jgi:hypothetical protein